LGLSVNSKTAGRWWSIRDVRSLKLHGLDGKRLVTGIRRPY